MSIEKKTHKNHAFLGFSLLIILLICSITPSIASAATYYLDAVNGNDSNPGSSDQPWQTMVKIASSSNSGDNIIIRNMNEPITKVDWPSDRLYQAQTISQFGITWTFEGDYQIGQFANHDMWVVGPVTIIGITPLSTAVDAGDPVWVPNGAMIDPDPTNNSQGYDSTMRLNTYDAELNVALDVDAGSPLVLPAGSSLISYYSRDTRGDELGVGDYQQGLTAAVLTALAEAPPANSFRPGYCGSGKVPAYTTADINYNLLAKLTTVAGQPTLHKDTYDDPTDQTETVERMFERVWIEHRASYGSRGMRPLYNQTDYGSDLANQVGIGAMMLQLNLEDATKEKLAISYIQLGIDLYSIVAAGGIDLWKADGGHNAGMKMPIIMAGVLLNDSDMKAIGQKSGDYLYSGEYGAGNVPPDYIHFQEDDQTFYVKAADVYTQPYTLGYSGTPDTTGTIKVTNGSNIIEGVGTSFTNWNGGTALRFIAVEGQGDDQAYKKDGAAYWIMGTQVSNNGTNYYCVAQHNSGTGHYSEPGSGTIWGNYWYEGGNGIHGAWAEDTEYYPYVAPDDTHLYVSKAYTGTTDVTGNMTYYHHTSLYYGHGSGSGFYDWVEFEEADIGKPSWGVTHAVTPLRDGLWDPGYMRLNLQGWAGHFAMIIMEGAAGTKTLWNHDALFDLIDYWMETMHPTNGEAGRQSNVFVENMWDKYRANYGDVWGSDPGNSPPVLGAIGDKSVNENSFLTFTVTATDADDDTIIYSTTGLPSGATFSSQIFSWTPGHDQVGTHQITFTVSDGQAQDSEAITITVHDSTDPVISNIQSTNVEESTASITWTTDEAATSQVEYGTTTGYGNLTNLDANLVTSHSAALVDLEPGTDYHFRVRSEDAAGNEAVSGDHTFTTQDSTPSVGSLTVSIVPQQVINAGAQWNVDGGAWKNSNDTVVGLLVGDHTVNYKSITGWTAPSSEVVTINAGQTTTESGTYTQLTYTLAVTATNGSVTKNPDQAIYNHGDTVTILCTANPGYNFTNWSGDYTGSDNPTTITMNGNKAITTVCQADTYTLTASATNGTISKSPDQASYNYNSTVTLTATPATGYHFTGWSGGLTGSDNPGTITMDTDKSVVANFEIDTYTLAVMATNGSVTKNPDQATYNHGDTVTILCTANPGYNFTNWSGDYTGSDNPATITMNGNKAITTVCQADTYTLTASATNGTISKSPDQASYNYNSTVTLTATPATGYHFTGWSGGLTGSDNPATITMDTDKSVTANFAVDTTYALIINAPNGSVTKNPDKQTYNPGETVTLQATASSGYHFTGWSGNLTGAINPTTVTMDAEKSVTANFAVNAPPIADAGPDQTVTDSDGNGSEQVNLDGSGSSDSDGPIASYAWSESGAQIATGANPNVMLATGIHTITLTVTDNDGATDTDTLTVTVNTPANQAPIANAGRDQTVTDSDSNGSEQVTLDGSGSSDSDGPIQSHIWSESGAQIATGANPNVTLATGIHTITLTVTDDDGASDTDTVIITVSDEKNLDTDDVNPPTVANCSPSPGSIQAPLNTLIVLHVVDVGAGVDRSSVVIRVENDIIYTGDVNECISSLGRCRRTGTKADYTFTYQPKTNFDYDQTVNVTVNTTDLSEKTMPEYAYSFKTEMRKFGGKKRIDLDGISLFQSNPATVRDSQGNVWVAWEAGPVGFRNIYVSKLPDGASYFENVMQITNNSYDQCRPTIAIDNNDKLYLAWQENPKGNWDIYFSSSTDGVYWISAVKVANTNANQTNPSLAVDSLLSNQVYLAWQDDRKGDYDIYFVSSNDDFAGKTIIPIATDPADQTEPVMAIDSENTVYVIWTDARDGSNDIYGAASDNGPWTNVPIVNNDYNQSSPAIALESEGNILHLLWVDDASGNKDICYGATAGGLPENPLTGINIVDDSSGADQSCPKIITGLDSNNNLKVFACWQDERNIIVGANDSDNDIDIYFSETEPLDRLSNSAAQVVFGTNIWVTDDDLTNAGQYHPVMNLDIKGHPYIVWVDTRNGNEEVYYTGTTLINSDTLAISEIIATQGGIVGTHPDNITGENDISVEIPAGAFWVDAEVSISRVDNPPSSTGLTAMDIISRYEFGPSSNLEFSRPVTIIIPYEVTNPDDDSVYWNNLQTGDLGQSEVSNVERIIISPTLHAIRYKTTHF